MPDAPASSFALPALKPYPMVLPKERKGLDKHAHALLARLSLPFARRHLLALQHAVRIAGKLEPQFSGLDDAALDRAARDVSMRLRRHGVEQMPLRSEALALIREVTHRTLGNRAYDVQLLGAATLMAGHIAEMATGEGKTMTAAMAAALTALAGRPVHVVTVNDYLAERDAVLGQPLFSRLGFTLGIVVSGQQLAERQAAYACDIVYCTNKELTFDALRDRLVLGDGDGDTRLRFEALRGEDTRQRKLRMRGLVAAIVDEADSVLVDEARTPLIISESAPLPFDLASAQEALRLAELLQQGRDYEVVALEHRVGLTPAGRETIADFAQGRGEQWRGVIRREELIRQAISAIRLFHRDHHYMVRENKVVIIDEHTGRAMPDRSWSDGLHQLVEIKEGLEPSAARRTLARMTYQRFFRRYQYLGGLTGTASQVAGELKLVYGLDVVPIPTHRKLQRVTVPARVHGSAERHWQAVIERVRQLHERGAPVLIGTRSVASSIEAGRRLGEAGLPHQVLNARQDATEAEIVAGAGNRGAITIATNMAGRGTDIKLGPGVEELGGLHVVMIERHEARRIDRQLAGRSGRQGQRGRFEPILSVEDPILVDGGGKWLAGMARGVLAVLGSRGAAFCINLAQLRLERTHAGMRRSLLRSDAQQAKTLAFSGRGE
ncbi:MAG TPA: prepilin peptidase [Devosia sp.]|uniref:preprotein translocase subunit SecA n=1 Tax=Devosia sp. TaxID=1871048 RepID=UPI002DDD6D96|nr:prepilin peptidase [Devosia sp.]HEV2517590.1 prepilin peptidase [Devosia sp.]